MCLLLGERREPIGADLGSVRHGENWAGAGAVLPFSSDLGAKSKGLPLSVLRAQVTKA